MKKINFKISFLLAILFVVISCNNTATYIDYLNSEKKSIKKFIKENNIKVLTEYPSDSTFADNEYYYDPVTGVYYNVIDKGDRKPLLGEEIYIRYKDVRYISDNDTTVYDGNFFSIYGPETLTYGNSTTYPCKGWLAPIPKVGNNGRVKMIVPFNSGTSYNQTYYYTVYYGLVLYHVEEPNTTNE